MNTLAHPFTLVKKKLKNGLTIAVKPNHTIPSVSLQLWYNVGSKDEKDSERGMAHLIEHMIFKGTNMLSETDINLLTHKLSGYANAFTSYDYTSYVFRFPSNVWKIALEVFADCMQHARFDEQMLNSEVKAVIQELKMYKDDFQSTVIEQLFSAVMTPHPYHHPIIGYKEDLWNLKRDTLYNFYKKHYHPGNALLVVAGDVDPEEVFTVVEEFFGNIPAHDDYHKEEFFVQHDIVQKQVDVYRVLEQPWTCFAYLIPGLKAQKSHLFYMISLLLARGKTSKLYKHLVDDLEIAVDVQCFSYDLFDDQFLFICATPRDEASMPTIKIEVNRIIEQVINDGIAAWELEAIKKKAQMDYLSLFESNDQAATIIGQMFFGTGNEDYLLNYLTLVQNTSIQDLQEIMNQYLRPTLQHAGYLRSLPDAEEKYIAQLQEESDELDAKILEKKQRESQVESPRFALSLQDPKPVAFTYPKPQSFRLKNGLEILWYHNAQVPKIAISLHQKANHYYDPEEKLGLSYLHSKLLAEGTISHNAYELHKLFEEKGISLSIDPGSIDCETLTIDFESTLRLINEIISEPLLPKKSLEKARNQVLNELKEYWDTPTAFVKQLARDQIYKSHPWRKPVYGTIETIKNISYEDILTYQDQYISPHGAVLILVGDLSNYTQDSLHQLLETMFGKWKGEVVKELNLPPISWKPTLPIDYPLQRDQVVICFTAPSVERKNHHYDALALLDIILLGGASGSMNSRLFQLREETGLFYTIGGSLCEGAGKAPGAIFIMTIVSKENVFVAESAIKNVLKDVLDNGISQEEFNAAKHVLMQSAMRYFESNSHIASAFYFLWVQQLPFDLFDKRGDNLAILRLENVYEAASCYIDPVQFDEIRIGRLT